MRAMTRLERLALARLCQALERVMADGVEQAVAGGAILLLDHDERLIDEPREYIQLARADGLHRGEVKATRERAEATEEGALHLVEQLVAPVERGGERLLARQGGTPTRREHAKRIAQPLGDLRRREDADTGGRQLNRQRDPVDPPADLRYRVGVLLGEDEARGDRGGAISEQLGRLARPKRGHAPVDLARDVQRLATRGEDPEIRAMGQKTLDETGTRNDEVLAVVEHHEHLRLAHVRGDRLLRRAG